MIILKCWVWIFDANVVAAGHYIGVINVPITFPADPVNGFMLSGMDAPDIKTPGFTHPPHLLDELYRQGMDYILDVENLASLSQDDPKRALQKIERMVDVRARTILHLMETRTWDVLMAVFVAPDRVQHFFWPEKPVPIENDQWIPILNVYRHIDLFLEKVLQLIDGETTILLVSDHGFGGAQSVSNALNPLLAQLGLLHYCQGGGKLRQNLLKQLLFWGRKLIPLPLQAPLAHAFSRLHRRARKESMFPGINWSRTQVFVGQYGENIRINLKGREAEGTVSPKEYDSLIEKVRTILLSLVDPDTNHSLVRTVCRREDLYHGPYLEQAADLIIEWQEEVKANAFCYCSEENPHMIQASQREVSNPSFRGTHRSKGIFIAWGPHIKKGRMISNVTHYDIAPTIFYLQGQPILKDMDGKVLTDIFEDYHLHESPVRYIEPSDAMLQKPVVGLNPEEAQKIEERLKGLGYLG